MKCNVIVSFISYFFVLVICSACQKNHKVAIEQLPWALDQVVETEEAIRNTRSSREVYQR